MKIFLAGGFNGNLNPLWGEMVKRLKEGATKAEAFSSAQTFFLNGEDGCVSSIDGINVLESYYYARDKKILDTLIPCADTFLLDSGAFTFMQGNGGTVDWFDFAARYSDYILAHGIKHYLELDIDSIVGLKTVEKIRSFIENRTHRKCIPVWHVERGKQYFVDMCKDYDYVALGSIAKVVPGKMKITEKYFPWFTNTAKQYGSKVHALGYTPKDLSKFSFYSVDSTNWLYGNMAGYAYKFDYRTGKMETVKKPDPSMKVKGRKLCLHNYGEWLKYMRYAEQHFNGWRR